jgi:hypothetical protein
MALSCEDSGAVQKDIMQSEARARAVARGMRACERTRAVSEGRCQKGMTAFVCCNAGLGGPRLQLGFREEGSE